MQKHRSVYEPAHIFPLESESYWVERNYGKWVRNIIPGVAKINSQQNGFLLQGTIHTDFDNYLISVNSNVSLLALYLIFSDLLKDGHKIVVFGLDGSGWTVEPLALFVAIPQIHRVSD